MSHSLLSDATKKRIAEFATFTGKTASAAANEAVNEWLEVYGDPILKRIKRREQAQRNPNRCCRKLVAFPGNNSASAG